MPRLAKYGLVCNHNLIPSAVETGRPPINVHFQDYVGRASEARLKALQVEGFGSLDPAGDRVSLGQRLSNFVKSRSMAEQRKIQDELLPAINEDHDFWPTPMMKEAEWKHAASVHEIGAHSFEHASLAFETDDYVRDDARRCRSWIEERLGVMTDIYAVPNGSVNERTANLIRAEGFKHVLLTGERHARATDQEPGRFTMYGETRAELRVRACGWTGRSA
ncbi:polysaccharide deacetylase family protein [Sphingomonas sp. LHG3406-1]|uniref:polysaccharide deacetylase family protein n=1 Tax=Sphingomonas sp. LHG3406-1 TaxID=2804617 RepID=UPI0026277C65|nr:polysaccharide deacetylase family protein [Sphingomonas sp. LHG3406-1]